MKNNHKNTFSIIVFFLILTASAMLSACGGAKHESPAPQPSSATPAGHSEHGGAATSNAAYQFDWRFLPSEVKPGEPVRISYALKDSSGRAVTQFDEVHEKLTHLILVSSDLAYFDHLHPELKDGEFSISTTLPSSGNYKLYADVTPTGGSQQLAPHAFRVFGDAAPSPAPLRVDEQSTKIFGDLSVTLKASPQSLQGGKDAALTFVLKDAGTGKPVTDLDRYLGAFGHCVIISEDTEQFLHTHPTQEGEEMKGMEMKGDQKEEHGEHSKKAPHQHAEMKGTGGPDVIFHTTFPASGLYRIWGQFSYHGKIVTADFVVRVQ